MWVGEWCAQMFPTTITKRFFGNILGVFCALRVWPTFTHSQQCNSMFFRLRSKLTILKSFNDFLLERKKKICFSWSQKKKNLLKNATQNNEARTPTSCVVTFRMFHQPIYFSPIVFTSHPIKNRWKATNTKIFPARFSPRKKKKCKSGKFCWWMLKLFMLPVYVQSSVDFRLVKS